jgi:murein DD-endopeptidase MepM/ murein hydrolase activator NlpD
MLPRMGVSARAALLASSLAAALLLAGGGAAARTGNSDVAALQVALRAKGVYRGDVDGIAGPQTERAVRVLQRRARVRVDGVVGPQTRSVLGRFSRHQLGRRILRRKMIGWDVAELQFLLAWHGFPSGPFDGRLGARTERAVIRFQRWAGLAVDGWAGPATISILRAPLPLSPIRLSAPIAAPVGDVFGPRGDRFHAGVDFPAPWGAPVIATAAGRVSYAGWLRGGWGSVVSLAHAGGVRTTYAHLSRIDVRVGQRVASGRRVGLVGATGNATGPHLHFEVRLRGAFVDPLTAIR